MTTQTALHPDPAPLAPNAGDDAGLREMPRPLSPGTRLRDYEVQAVVSSGPSGFVYRAVDHALQRLVAIKEFVPDSMASRTAGSAAVVIGSERHFDAYRAALNAFVDEARVLARFAHPSLVKVYRFWEENGTAYRAMPFHEGPTLRTALVGLGRVPGEGEIRAWLRPVLDAVAAMHDGRVWHEHVAPGNILLTPTGPVLLGTAAPRRTLATLAGAPAAALDAGCAAIEQYGGTDRAASARGPWTDLYALAAVVHGAITGEAPQAAPDRARDDKVKPLSIVAAGLYSAEFLAAVDAAMAVQPERRPQDHLRFRALMGDIEAPEMLQLAPRRDLMQEPFIAGAGEREVTVPDRPLAQNAAPVPTPSRPAPLTMPPRGGDRDVRARPAATVASRHKDDRARRGTAGKRALYGVVAVSFVLIGLAALGLRFQSRQASVPTVAPSPTATATPAVAGTAPARAGLPGGVEAAPTSPLVPASAPVTGSPSVSAALPIEVQSRCLDILQKASLEPITAAETAFFKKECR